MSVLLKQPAKAAAQLQSVWSLAALRSINLSACHGCFSTAKPPNQHYDIIIGGGGLVGTTLAAAITKNPTLAEKRVLLLEGGPPFKGFDAKGQYGNRVSAINNNTIELFKSIGAWERIAEARAKSVKQMQVWDGSSDALIQFQHDHFAEDVACIVENDLMLHAVYSLLRDPSAAEICQNVEVRNRARIEWVRLPGDTGTERSEVGLEGGETLTCELLIGADGANSLVRRQMKVDVFSIDYERMGLVATLDLGADAGDNSVAWQRFVPSGPIALLPLSDTISSLVWSTTIPQAKHLADMKEEDFVDAVNEAFCKEYQKSDMVTTALNALNSIMGRAGPAQLRQYPPRVCGVLPKSRATFPLGFLHASSYICSGAALIGDAAHRIHPLAGQGVNLGFSDVRFLVESLAEGAYAGAKLGDKHYLIKYEQKSLTKNVPILIGVHGIHTLYSTTFSPVVLMRSLGLQLTQNVPQIKDLFMKRAMG